MIDCSDDSCFGAYETLCRELEGFSVELLKKPHIVLCNKIDLEGSKERAEQIAGQIKKTEPETTVLPVSVAAHIGMNDIRLAILDLVTKLDGTPQQFNADGTTVSSGSFLTNKKEGTSLNPTFMSTRSVDEDAEIQFPGSEN